MEIIKFHQSKTNELIYVVTGAKTKNDAFHFVRDYKKIKLVNMLMTHRIMKGKIVKVGDRYELYVTALNDIKGTDCYVIARNNIELNPKKIYAQG